MGQGERRADDAHALSVASVIPAYLKQADMREAATTRRLRHIAYHIQLKARGVTPMALTTLTLEVRTDFRDAEKQLALLEAVKMAAREITTTAALLQEQQTPEIHLYENTLEGSRVVNVMEGVDA